MMEKDNTDFLKMLECPKTLIGSWDDAQISFCQNANEKSPFYYFAIFEYVENYPGH